MKKFLVLSLLIILPATIFGMEKQKLTAVDCCGRVQGNGGYPYDDRFDDESHEFVAVVCPGTCLLTTLSACSTGYLLRASVPWLRSIVIGSVYSSIASGAILCGGPRRTHSCLCGRIKNYVHEHKNKMHDQQVPLYQSLDMGVHTKAE